VALITRTAWVDNLQTSFSSATYRAEAKSSESLAAFGGVGGSHPYGFVFDDGSLRDCMFLHAIKGDGDPGYIWDGPGNACPDLVVPPPLVTGVFVRGYEAHSFSTALTGYRTTWSRSTLYPFPSTYSVTAYKAGITATRFADPPTVGGRDTLVYNKLQGQGRTDVLAYLFPEEFGNPALYVPYSQETVLGPVQVRFTATKLGSNGTPVTIGFLSRPLSLAWPPGASGFLTIAPGTTTDWIDIGLGSTPVLLSAIAGVLASSQDAGYDPSHGDLNDRVMQVSVESQIFVTRTIRSKTAPPLHQRQRTGGAEGHAAHHSSGINTRQGKFSRGML
jgi:hypothetical protein